MLSEISDVKPPRVQDIFIGNELMEDLTPAAMAKTFERLPAETWSGYINLNFPPIPPPTLP